MGLFSFKRNSKSLDLRWLSAMNYFNCVVALFSLSAMIIFARDYPHLWDLYATISIGYTCFYVILNCGFANIFCFFVCTKPQGCKKE